MRMVDRQGRGARVRSGPAGGGQFLRFCCVGAAGFSVDALILLGLVHGAGAGPVPARLLSAVVSILTTFELNRRWAFRGAAARSYGSALAAYAAMQSLGLGCNLTVYTGCYLLLPPRLGAPLVCLVAASAAALAVNYAGASRVVFRPVAP